MVRENGDAEWDHTYLLERRKFKCGFCGESADTKVGFYAKGAPWAIMVCSACTRPTFFEGDKQCPAPLLGNDVSDVPPDISELYDEARGCTAVAAYTPAVLACRKLLMNIAVEKDAEEGKKFSEYVKYLADKGYIPPGSKGWVDHIRKKGNEATHEIKLMSKEDAQDLLTLIEMLLRLIFEFPAKVPKEQTPET